MYTLYSLLLVLGALLTGPYWLCKAVREKKYVRGIGQRLGWGIPSWRLEQRPVWIHAVSVGEVLAAKPLLAALARSHASLPVIASVVTQTGDALARKELSQAAAHLFFPFDWRFCVNRFLQEYRPKAVILLETELWPNFIRACAQRHIPLFLANGRISDRSWRRYRRLTRLTKHVLSHFTAIGVQSAEDGRRLRVLGAPGDRVRVTGNLKFDFEIPAVDPDDGLLAGMRAALGLGADMPVVVVGSTMRGEESICLQAFAEIRRRIPEVRMILAPRHPERFGEVGALLQAAGLPFLRRSALDCRGVQEARVLLLDSIGELRRVYSLASVTVIGGSLLPFGGHNLLEPAALGKAIVFGPHMFNFKEAARLFLERQAARQCAAGGLAEAVADLLTDEHACRSMGQRARQTLRRNQGATAATLALLKPFLG